MAPAASAEPILDVQHVSKRWPGTIALNDVSLQVPPQQIRAIIGPNGAGKSTLFAVISGLIPPDTGRIYIAGRNTTRLPPYAIVRLGVARAFQVARLFPQLTARENVLAAVLAQTGSGRVFWRPLRSLRAQRATAEGLLAETGLKALADRPAAVLSQGDKKRLEIAMALALQPQLLLLDEPTAGMSPEETRATVVLIQQLWRERNLTVVLSEHDMSVVFALAQEITVLHRGSVLVSGAPEMVRNNERVQEVYLGTAESA
jgi:branched-chain amino acid transport system ATP-binding protein